MKRRVSTKYNVWLLNGKNLLVIKVDFGRVKKINQLGIWRT